MIRMSCSRWLGPEDLSLAERECPFCRGIDRVPVARLQQEPQILLLRCLTCKAASASPLPTNEALRQHYEDYDRIYALYSDHQRITCSRIARFASHLMRRTGESLNIPRVQILDFGGGDGGLSKALGRRLLAGGAEEVDITLVDYNAKYHGTEDPRLHVDFCQTLADAPSGLYDLVLASAVLEHLPHPARDLRRLVERVRVGGVLYARTPYFLPMARVASWLGLRLNFGYPGHLHDLGADFWQAAFAREPLSGFRLLSSRPSPVETSLRSNVLLAVASHVAKAPWHVLGNGYRLVGGWEVFGRREC